VKKSTSNGESVKDDDDAEQPGNRAAIALVLVMSVVVHANSTPAGGEDGQGASNQLASGLLVAADTLSESSQRRAIAFFLVARQRLRSRLGNRRLWRQIEATEGHLRR
ncbi:uncharacterized protein METZ01_LOCUS347863, partial [marine metagenome]